LAKKQYINYNGFLYEEDETIFTVKNRAFKYGDALFETIRVINGNPCFIEDHFKRLKHGMSVLKMEPTEISFKELLSQINNLLIKNGIKKGGRARLTVFRTGEGFYAPLKQGKSYLIEAVEIKDNAYVLNENGLNVDVFSDLKQSSNILSQIKTANCIPHILAGIYKTENNLNDCLILNEHGRITEAVSSNIFLYKNNNIYTPALEEGCMNGIMRKKVLEICKNLHINIFEGMITGSMLLKDYNG